MRSSKILLCALALAGCDDRKERPVATLTPTPPTPAVTAPAPVVAPAPTPIPEPTVAASPDAGAVAPELAVPETFAERVKLAKALAKDGNTVDAIAMYNRALELEENGAVHVELARILIQENDLRQADEQADYALKAAPSSSAAWNTKGRVLFLQRDLDGAHDAFSKAVDLNEDNVWAWNNKGLVEMELDSWTDAIASLERATAGDHAETYMFTNLARAYEHEKRMVEALATFKIAARRGSPTAQEAVKRLEDAKSARATEIVPQ